MGLFDIIGGGSIPDIKASGAFGDLEEFGATLRARLLGELDDPTGTEAFSRGSTAIREALSRQSATARQRLGDRAASGGFADSGVVNEGLSDIDRAELSATGNALSALILGIDDRAVGNALPFLFAGANEFSGAEMANLNASLQGRNQAFGLFQNLNEGEGFGF